MTVDRTRIRTALIDSEIKKVLEYLSDQIDAGVTGPTGATGATGPTGDTGPTGPGA